MITRTCPMCGATVDGADIESYGDAFVAHCTADHGDLPFPERAIRNFGEGMARTTGSAERLEEIGAVEIHPVTEERIDDWLDFFDHDAFAGFPQWSACYCLEPHHTEPDAPPSFLGTWRENRARMVELLRSGSAFGYLAYVDGRPAGWVNASKRGDYALFRRRDDEDDCTVGISCFCIAPPYQRHGLSRRLLDRVVADAGSRGAAVVEAYPFTDERANDNPNFRGGRPMYDDAGFTQVTVRQRDAVVRRPVS